MSELLTNQRDLSHHGACSQSQHWHSAWTKHSRTKNDWLSACILMANIPSAKTKLCYFNPSSRWRCSVFEAWHFQQLQNSTNTADSTEHAGWHCWTLLQKPHKTFPDNDTYFLAADSNSWFSLTHSFVSARLKKSCAWSQGNSAFIILVRRSRQRKENTHTLGFTSHKSQNIPCWKKPRRTIKSTC